MLALSAIVAFAFGNRALNTKKVETPVNNSFEKPLATTYFVFTGTLATQYTDSTKWEVHTTSPSPSCIGLAMACKVESTTLTTRTQLVNEIQKNSGVISGFATITETKS
ncbi:MAG TPA: hypothetical protein PLL71_01285 [Agriterribacter sp.]|nr:hypothetical protein [Agriterribacter sp.]